MSAENSQETIRSFLNTLSDGQRIFLFGVINLNQKGLEFSWDFDQVLIRSEIAVLNFVDNDLKTKYSGRKIKGWNSVAKWLKEDKLKFGKEADEYEDWVWTEPKIIKEAPPNESLRAFSYVAWQRGIKQTVNTSRPAKLAEVTYRQVKLYFPWLKDSVNQREVSEPGISGIDYKVGKVLERYKVNSNLVHLDDSMDCMRRLLQINPAIDIVGFPAPEDTHADLVGGKRIFFPDISLFNDLIYYPEVNVAQSFVSHIHIDTPGLSGVNFS